MDRLLFVFLLTAFINLINTLTRSSRLSGVRTKHLATAISLFSVVYLAASFANTLQAPLLASTVERTIESAYNQSLSVNPENVIETPLYQETLKDLNSKLRFVILGATLGTVVGMFSIPSFVTSFSNAIKSFGETGSVFKVIFLFLVSMFKPGSGILRFRMSSRETLRKLISLKMRIPKAFLYWNLASYSLWTANVLSGLYAGALYPEFRSTAVLMASIVGNASIIVSVMMVDPVLARVTDDVARGVRDEIELKQIVFFLAISNLLGTLLSQAIFEPVAWGLQYLTRWIT
ncbi:lipid II flippase family protein [Pelotomaculum propionicicum]|uniref:lipid II flippase family protein n=1 Tax=Pelotomaculum propionicicum TaxID=258475 RepID=UPI003B766B09